MKIECIFVSPRTRQDYQKVGTFLSSFGCVVDTSILPSAFLVLDIPASGSGCLDLGRLKEADGFFYKYTSNFISTMPRSNEVCARANNSTPVATLFHETENLVSIHNGQVVTTSLQVAEVFNKNHKEVLRSIRELDCSRDLQERNFAPSFYTVDLPNGGHKQQPMYYIGRDGFVFLVMGFTGKIAARFKEAYIRQFNEMEEMLRKSEETRYASRLLDAEVKRFNKEMQQYVRKKQMDGRKYFGGAGELRPGFFYYPDRLGDFKERLDTVFSQLRAAYADGFSCVEQMYLSRKKLDKVEVSVRDFFDSVYR